MKIVHPPPAESNPPPDGLEALSLLEQVVSFGWRLGWSFTPLDGKKPKLPKWTTRPRASLLEATTWAQQGNVGLRTGAASGGVVVIDCDSGADIDSLGLPSTVTVRTGSGGWHYYYRFDGPLGNSAGKLGPHIDIRADGGQVVLPGSVHPTTGEPYRWAPGCEPWATEIAPLPAHIIEKLTPRKPKTKANGAATNGTARASDRAKRAIAVEARRVASASEGQRNNTLNIAAYTLGGLIGSGHATRGEVEAALHEAADAVGLPEREIRETMKNGIDAGIAAPWTPDQPAAAEKDSEPPPEWYACEGAEPEASDGGESQPERPAQREFNRTDLGNAERLVAECGHDLRHCSGLGWLAWDGRRWQVDATGEAQRRAKKTARKLFREACGARDKDLFAWAVKTESASRIAAMLTLASTEASIAVAVDELDSDQWLLNIHNGTLDLRTGILKPHDQRDLITKLAGVAFDPHATAPTWAAFLERIFAGDAELIGFAQRAAGSALAGAVREHALHVMHGIGANGKSTFLKALLGLLGDYGGMAASKLLMKRNSDAHPTELADLRGKRFVASIETGEGGRLDEERVKMLTGGDRIKARLMRQDFIEFAPTWSLFLATNHCPNVQGQDEGIWRRVRLWPFTVSIPEAEQDPDFDTKLAAARPGILNWCLAGCLAWQRDGLGRAASIAQATAAYRDNVDVLGTWLSERCIVEAGRCEFATALYQNYEAWAKTNGEHPVNGTRFGTALGERGFKRRKSHGVIVRDGLSLLGSGTVGG